MPTGHADWTLLNVRQHARTLNLRLKPEHVRACGLEKPVVTRTTQDKDDDVMFMGVESPAPATPPAEDEVDDLPTLESSNVRHEESMDEEEEATIDVKPRMHETATPPSPLTSVTYFYAIEDGQLCIKSSDGVIVQRNVPSPYATPKPLATSSRLSTASTTKVDCPEKRVTAPKTPATAPSSGRMVNDKFPS